MLHHLADNSRTLSRHRTIILEYLTRIGVNVVLANE